jgi:hypothetical protein
VVAEQGPIWQKLSVVAALPECKRRGRGSKWVEGRHRAEFKVVVKVVKGKVQGKVGCKVKDRGKAKDKVECKAKGRGKVDRCSRHKDRVEGRVARRGAEGIITTATTAKEGKAGEAT